MTTDIYNAMLEAINTGRVKSVIDKKDGYLMTPKQSESLTRMISEVINK
jgi:hypothetical protein